MNLDKKFYVEHSKGSMTNLGPRENEMDAVFDSSPLIKRA